VPRAQASHRCKSIGTHGLCIAGYRSTLNPFSAARNPGPANTREHKPATQHRQTLHLNQHRHQALHPGRACFNLLTCELRPLISVSKSWPGRSTLMLTLAGSDWPNARALSPPLLHAAPVSTLTAHGMQSSDAGLSGEPLQAVRLRLNYLEKLPPVPYAAMALKPWCLLLRALTPSLTLSQKLLHCWSARHAGLNQSRSARPRTRLGGK